MEGIDVNYMGVIDDGVFWLMMGIIWLFDVKFGFFFFFVK